MISPLVYKVSVRKCAAGTHKAASVSRFLRAPQDLPREGYIGEEDLRRDHVRVIASVFKTPRPARVTVGVAALAVPTAHVEIMVTAQRQASKN
jgi:enamine deaminase RidA (YjgF/YER057c/UK114 family)